MDRVRFFKIQIENKSTTDLSDN